MKVKYGPQKVTSLLQGNLWTQPHSQTDSFCDNFQLKEKVLDRPERENTKNPGFHPVFTLRQLREYRELIEVYS